MLPLRMSIIIIKIGLKIQLQASMQGCKLIDKIQQLLRSLIQIISMLKMVKIKSKVRRKEICLFTKTEVFIFVE